MKGVMLYDVSPDGLVKAMEHFAGHRARLHEFHFAMPIHAGRARWEVA